MKDTADAGSQNITLSLPKALVRKVRLLAAERDSSISALLSGYIRDVVEREEAFASARRRALDRLRAPANLGTRGIRRWMRDELHDR